MSRLLNTTALTLRLGVDDASIVGKQVSTQERLNKMTMKLVLIVKNLKRLQLHDELNVTSSCSSISSNSIVCPDNFRRTSISIGRLTKSLSLDFGHL